LCPHSTTHNSMEQNCNSKRNQFCNLHTAILVRLYLTFLHFSSLLLNSSVLTQEADSLPLMNRAEKGVGDGPRPQVPHTCNLYAYELPSVLARLS
jgi:hypothetical protein